MADERYFFSTSVENMVHGLTPLANAMELKARLLAEGLDLDHIPPAIPAHLFYRYIEAAAAFVWPDVPIEEALRLAGLEQVRGWRKTTLGAASSALLLLIGPERSFRRLDRAFRTGDNFTRTSVEFLSPGDALVTFNSDGRIKTFLVGIMQGALEMIGRVGTVRVESSTAATLTLRITWN